jgi:muconate cycloisomerase
MPAFLREAYPALCCEFGREIGVMVDEGVCSLEDAAWLIARGGATAFNLKVGKHGGLLGALRVHALAAAHGIPCQLGAFVGETSILSAAGRILAGLAGGLTAHEGSAGAHLLEHDVVAAPLGFGQGGRASLADVEGSGGLGIEVDPALVARAIATAHVRTS